MDDVSADAELRRFRAELAEATRRFVEHAATARDEAYRLKPPGMVLCWHVPVMCSEPDDDFFAASNTVRYRFEHHYLASAEACDHTRSGGLAWQYG